MKKNATSVNIRTNKRNISKLYLLLLMIKKVLLHTFFELIFGLRMSLQGILSVNSFCLRKCFIFLVLVLFFQEKVVEFRTIIFEIFSLIRFVDLSGKLFILLFTASILACF